LEEFRHVQKTQTGDGTPEKPALVRQMAFPGAPSPRKIR